MEYLVSNSKSIFQEFRLTFESKLVGPFDARFTQSLTLLNKSNAIERIIFYFMEINSRNKCCMMLRALCERHQTVFVHLGVGDSSRIKTSGILGCSCLLFVACLVS